MRSFTIDNKTGFFSSGTLLIFDEEKNPFYYHNNCAGKINFNLPAGKYFTDSKFFEQLPEPVEYEKFSLPYTGSFPLTEKVKVGRNVNKATIYVNNKAMFFDKSIINHWYKPTVVFVICHETGHNFFTDENMCDDYANNCMFDLGFNPSQIEVGRNFLLKENLPRCHHFQKQKENKNYRK